VFELLPTITEGNYEDFIEYEAAMFVKHSAAFLGQIEENNHSLWDGIEASVRLVAVEASGGIREQVAQKSRTAILLVLRLMERELQAKSID